MSKYDPRVKAFYREVASAIAADVSIASARTADVRKREGYV